MLLSHFKRLCIISATLIAASPLATVAPRSTTLPSLLQQDVPTCAQSCLQASLVEKFPVACTGQGDIQCLCSRYSNGGESLGEVALGCVYSFCSTMDPGAASAYNICYGQKDAVRPTKTALTVIPSSTSRTTSISSSTKSIASPSITTTLQTRATSTQSIFVDSVSFTPSATPSPSSTFVAAPVAAQEPPKMTPAQIAGLSVAAVAAFVVAVGLMALSVCLRRRRERKKQFDSDEKGTSQKSKKYSTRVSRYVPVNSFPEAPRQFPMRPPPAARRGDTYPKSSQSQSKDHPATLIPSRPVQRNGVGTSNSSSNSSLPLDQIGVAISAELDGTSASLQTSRQNEWRASLNTKQQQAPKAAVRPISTMTQETVFEEDDVAARRRSSVLLPTPPVPIPPIRQLQPSRPAATSNIAAQFPFPPTKDGPQLARRSELFLSIPVRHERPQPQRIIGPSMPSTGSPAKIQPKLMNRLAPPVRTETSSSPQKTPASSRGQNSPGDIIDDYYFSSRTDTTPRASPAQFTRPKESPRAVQIRSKRSRSTVSRTSSRASTNIRDSLSSQTSFESADPSEPTPEDDDDDKQLSDENKLSPVAESPISNLRYPKVPRSSNQLVPRSPRSGQNFNKLKGLKSQPAPKRSQTSLKAAPSPPVLLPNRGKELPPLLLETRVPLKLNAPKDMAVVREPLKDPFVSPPRQTHARARAHIRSNSTESWSTTPLSKVDRKSRTQSGMWPSSPAMYETEFIKPLNVRPKNESLVARRRKDEMKEINVGRDIDHDADGLKSPVWIPKLTPTRKGDDLFISVGWGEGRP